MSEEQQILSDYQKYDFLNQEERPLVKIFVNYIKPAFLFKTKILTPMHLGRAVETENSKLGTVSEQDLNWLHKNCVFNDDFEGGISRHNRRIGFFTGAFFAWKNYQKIGDPEYFGSFGYRRLLDSALLNGLTNYDAIIPYRVDFTLTGPTIEEHVKKLQGPNLMNAILQVMTEIHLDELDDFRQYLKETSAYMNEIYVMKKDVFFDYCNWIWPMLEKLLNFSTEDLSFGNINTLESQFVANAGETRDIAYAMEILTGYYAYKLARNVNIKCKHVSTLYIKNEQAETKRNSQIASLLRNKLKKS